MCPVFIENISSDSKIKLLSLKKLAQKILRDFKERGDLNIILVSDGYMKKLNQRFTRRKGTTDVLSFSFREKGVTKDKGVFLGEVYISADKARKQAEDYQVSFDQELKRLVAHGVLHLLGYEHKSKKDEEGMSKEEEKYIF
ncbi:MAG TPA: rRNA maturation RNase YbeY [candidate division Zixibacteria bacterium]